MFHSLYRLKDATDDGCYLVSLSSFDRRIASQEEVRGRDGVISALLGIMTRTAVGRSPETALHNAVRAREAAAAENAALALMDELGVPKDSPTRHETESVCELRHRQAEQAVLEARQLLERLELWHTLAGMHRDGTEVDFDAPLPQRDVLALWPDRDRTDEDLTVADAIWDMTVSGGGAPAHLMSSTWRVRIDVIKSEDTPA